MAKVGIVKIEQWPASHRSAWEAGLRPPMFIDEAGVAARWRQQTIKTTAASYGRWLWFLREMEWLDDGAPAGQLLSIDCLRAYLLHLQETNAPATVLHRIIGLERALAVLCPALNRSLLRRLINNLSEDYQPPSKRGRIQEADALLELGFKLMKQALSEPGRSRRRRASMFRDGFAIALMAMRPLRLKNFISIEIGRHLVKIGGAWRLVFPGTETKNHKPIDVAFPLELVAALEAYLHTHRPCLADGKYDGPALWVSYWWKPMSPISMRHEVCKWTEQAFGFPVTPHRFRDSAATALAIHEPEQVQIAHHILGNDYLTMQGTYNQAKGADAVRHFNGSMSARRSEPGAGRRPLRRRA